MFPLTLSSLPPLLFCLSSILLFPISWLLFHVNYYYFQHHNNLYTGCRLNKDSPVILFVTGIIQTSWDKQQRDGVIRDGRLSKCSVLIMKNRCGLDGPWQHLKNKTIDPKLMWLLSKHYFISLKYGYGDFHLELWKNRSAESADVRFHILYTF
jgi:hypothetical protein